MNKIQVDYVFFLISSLKKKFFLSIFLSTGALLIPGLIRPKSFDLQGSLSFELKKLLIVVKVSHRDIRNPICAGFYYID